MILMMLDASKGDKERDVLENELDQCGVRLNTRPVDICFVRKKTGGIKYTATARSLKNGLDEAGCKAILQEYTCHNCEAIIKEDATRDESVGRPAPYSQAPYSQTQSAAVRSPLGASRRHPLKFRVSLLTLCPAYGLTRCRESSRVLRAVSYEWRARLCHTECLPQICQRREHLFVPELPASTRL
jgi:hypothetical protein